MTAERTGEWRDDAGVVRTRLSRVEGEAGELQIGGFPVEELAGRVSYEEVVHLLWEGSLPDADRLAGLKQALSERRGLSPIILDVLRTAAGQRLAPITALRSAAGLLDLRPSSHETRSGDLIQMREDALTAVAAFPTIIAAFARLLGGQEPVPPRSDLGHAANYLFMLGGQEAAREQISALETYLVTVSDHAVSASTFAARVIVSTGSDLLSAVVGAVGALKGPLHGGAPGPVLDMLLEIGEGDAAVGWLRARLEGGERLMGFGHRDYKLRDPRAVVLEAATERLARHQGNRALYTLAKRVEGEALVLLEEYKPGRRLNTNLEFWVAVLLDGIGLPPALFTPTFAAARTAGWAAHCFEQAAFGRMLQPRSIYWADTGSEP
jgi:citrate synthase